MQLCRPSICNSCSADLLQEILELLQSYNILYKQNPDNSLNLIDSQRADLLKIVEENNDKSRKVLKDKSFGKPITRCREEQVDIWKNVK